jgi:hypothetical protein
MNAESAPSHPSVLLGHDEALRQAVDAFEPIMFSVRYT